jgi:hypothetical protein
MLIGPRIITIDPSLAVPPERNTRTPGSVAWSSSDKVRAVDCAISAESMTRTLAPQLRVEVRDSGAMGTVVPTPSESGLRCAAAVAAGRARSPATSREYVLSRCIALYGAFEMVDCNVVIELSDSTVVRQRQ